MMASGTSVTMMPTVMASRMWRWMCWAEGFSLWLGADSLKILLLGIGRLVALGCAHSAC